MIECVDKLFTFKQVKLQLLPEIKHLLLEYEKHPD